VAGHDIAHDPVSAKKKLAYVPDDPRLFEALTVWEHLEFVAATYRVPDFVQSAEHLLDQFELTDKKNTTAQELSRGMKQKVIICCAYLPRPDVILFDEPLNGLDPRAIRTFKESVAAQADGGAAIIISSHLLSVVEDMCSHLLILDRGVKRFCGPIDEALRSFSADCSKESLEDIFFRLTES
jgi:ABC-2 type transport system ATP-binding protein